MKLLKFVNSDAPHTLAGVQLRNHRLWFPGKRGNAAVAAKSWSLDTSACSSFSGGYWLLDDDNNPICELTDIVLAVPETATNAAAAVHSGSSSSSSSTFAPRGVTDTEVDGIDFRSKMGRQMERERATYGATSKTATKSTRTMMNAESVTEKRNERLKRDRETVAETIESNHIDAAGVGSAPRKESKRAKKQAH
ncbi:hypothetical protein NESM_000869700 [Novymonas esmeraldas]|uniref:Uncharacterized protein n=1 Tax=Novymonas esmeraldas TaxID=1808958 RepID=A0AAW0F1A6_9TRYP